MLRMTERVAMATSPAATSLSARRVRSNVLPQSTSRNHLHGQSNKENAENNMAYHMHDGIKKYDSKDSEPRTDVHHRRTSPERPTFAPGSYIYEYSNLTLSSASSSNGASNSNSSLYVAHSAGYVCRTLTDEVHITNASVIRRRYRCQRALGRGGFARCFEVIEEGGSEDGTHYALKVVSRASLSKPKTLQKLHSEIAIHQRMKHIHIVNFVRTFSDRHYIYMVLELCSNGTLMDLIKIRPLNVSEAQYITLQCLLAMQYMQENGVIHRDLKPSNIMLDAEMRVKIGDFGLAAELQYEGQRKRTVCGTPNYIAPEIINRHGVGHSYEVDTWSLGVMVYTVLVGKPPFQMENLAQTYSCIRDCRYVIPDGVPYFARRLIQKILINNPTHRPTLLEIRTDDFFICPPAPMKPPVSFASYDVTMHGETPATRELAAATSTANPNKNKNSIDANKNNGKNDTITQVAGAAKITSATANAAHAAKPKMTVLPLSSCTAATPVATVSLARASHRTHSPRETHVQQPHSVRAGAAEASAAHNQKYNPVNRNTDNHTDKHHIKSNQKYNTDNKNIDGDNYMVSHMHGCAGVVSRGESRDGAGRSAGQPANSCAHALVSHGSNGVADQTTSEARQTPRVGVLASVEQNRVVFTRQPTSNSMSTTPSRSTTPRRSSYDAKCQHPKYGNLLHNAHLKIKYGSKNANNGLVNEYYAKRKSMSKSRRNSSRSDKVYFTYNNHMDNSVSSYRSVNSHDHCRLARPRSVQRRLGQSSSSSSRSKSSRSSSETEDNMCVPRNSRHSAASRHPSLRPHHESQATSTSSQSQQRAAAATAACHTHSAQRQSKPMHLTVVSRSTTPSISARTSSPPYRLYRVHTHDVQQAEMEHATAAPMSAKARASMKLCVSGSSKDACAAFPRSDTHRIDASDHNNADDEDGCDDETMGKNRKYTNVNDNKDATCRSYLLHHKYEYEQCRANKEQNKTDSNQNKQTALDTNTPETMSHTARPRDSSTECAEDDVKSQSSDHSNKDNANTHTNDVDDNHRRDRHRRHNKRDDEGHEKEKDTSTDEGSANSGKSQSNDANHRRNGHAADTASVAVVGTTKDDRARMWAKKLSCWRSLLTPVWVTMYADFSDRFGLAYRLNTGHTGVHFNDSTRMIMHPDKDRVEYYELQMEASTKEAAAARGGVTGKYIKQCRVMFVKECNPAPYAAKKVLLIKFFCSYLDKGGLSCKHYKKYGVDVIRCTAYHPDSEFTAEKIIKSTNKDTNNQNKQNRSPPSSHQCPVTSPSSVSQPLSAKECNGDTAEQRTTAAAQQKPHCPVEKANYARYYHKTAEAMIFRLSNDFIQVCFHHGPDILIGCNSNVIAYTDIHGKRVVASAKWIAALSREAVDWARRAKKILDRMDRQDEKA